MSKPPFDPSKPFTPASDAKPAFDPSQPFESGDQSTTNIPGTIVHQGLQGFTQGYSDEAGGLGTGVLQALTNAMPDSLRERLGLVKADPVDAYRYSRDQERDLLKRQEAEHPNVATASKLGGNLLGAIALPELGGEGLAGAATTGIAQGAIMGGGESEADLTRGDVGGFAKDVLGGGAAGGAGGVAGYGLSKVLGAGARGVKRLATGVVKPTAAAQELMNEGVPLTIGQMSPRGSALSKLEEAGSHSALGGGIVRDARQEGLEGLQNAALNRTRPIPGALGPGDQADKLAQIYDEFETAYAPAKGHQIQALGQLGQNALAPVDKALQAIADDPNIYATDAERGAAKSWLANQTTPQQLGLSNVPANGSPPLVDSGALLKLRHNIRKELAKASAKGDDVKAEIMERAEKAITGGLQQQLPPDAMQALAETDAKYHQFRQVAGAISRSGDQPAGFTPTHLSGSVKSGANQLSYAMGGGGPMRDLAQAGKAAIDTREPMTGAKMFTLPFGLNHVVGPVAAAMNTETGKALLMGETGAQRALQGLAGAKPFAAMGKVGKMLRENPAALGKFGAVLSNISQQHGPEAAAAAHFVMSQSNPEYQRLASGDGEPETP